MQAIVAEEDTVQGIMFWPDHNFSVVFLMDGVGRILVNAESLYLWKIRYMCLFRYCCTLSSASRLILTKQDVHRRFRWMQREKLSVGTENIHQRMISASIL